MIQEAFRTRPTLNALFARHSDALELVVLTGDDWALLEHVYNFPVPFKEVTLKAEGHQAALDGATSGYTTNGTQQRRRSG